MSEWFRRRVAGEEGAVARGGTWAAAFLYMTARSKLRSLSTRASHSLQLRKRITRKCGAGDVPRARCSPRVRDKIHPAVDCHHSDFTKAYLGVP